MKKKNINLSNKISDDLSFKHKSFTRILVDKGVVLFWIKYFQHGRGRVTMDTSTLGNTNNTASR